MLVLLADHELATSTLAARVAASTRADPFAVVMTGLGAVSGPLHGKAALAVHRMFERAAESSPELALAHAAEGAPVAAGFGHPVYRGRDPRAAYLLTALAPLMRPRDRRLLEDVTKAASRAGSATPNVDFALGALAFALDMPFGATEAIFATARSAGWLLTRSRSTERRRCASGPERCTSARAPGEGNGPRPYPLFTDQVELR